MASTVTTVSGAVALGALGKTLMHEHLTAGFPGWETDTLAPGPDRRDLIALCVDQVEALKAAGFRSMVDPCPNDLGRDVDLMGEVAARTGFNIIAATGFYTDKLGGNAYWRTIASFDPEGCVERMAEVMIRELEDGGPGGLKPGIIKLATGTGRITPYEEVVFKAGARAALATGAPITTHTDAVLGDAQLALLQSQGVPAHRIIIGHCCGSRDHGYHMHLAGEGAYVGFDRFGVEGICPDAERTASLLQLLGAGVEQHMIISQDSVWCLRGRMLPKDRMEAMAKVHTPLRFEHHIAPQLRAAGVAQARIDALLIDNPRRYFSGEAAPQRVD
jgi:phosphotriesterase-related protein